MNVPAPWLVMWLLAGGLWAAAKLTTLRPALARAADKRRLAGYLLLWPGMDARGFLDPDRHPAPITPRDWLGPVVKTTLGFVLLVWGVRRLYPLSPLAAGWAGMIGLVLLLHFGTFALLALAWRRAGIDAQPLMQAPLKARTLAEFWGRRWNTAFHQVAATLVHRPLARRLGPPGATLATFAVSGLVHESVITLPAGGGFGGPTLYFILQGAGLIAQRTGPPILAGRAFAWIVLAAPVGLLFPPVFVHRVVLPFLDAFGALTDFNLLPP